MTRSLAKSNAHFRKSLELMPLGVSSNFRYWGDDETVYVKHGRGARLWDIDGNSYIDYRLGYGPAILGHCHPEVDAAAREGQQVGTVFALGTEGELAVARLIHEMVEAAELVRFSNSGTEAVMGALRLARGFTGKDQYVTFEGSYHGLFDSVMWTANMEAYKDPTSDPEIVPYGAGIPALVRQIFWQVPYNDAGRLEAVLKRDRQVAQRSNHLTLTLTRQFAIQFRQGHGEQHQRRKLCGERLGRGHTDFRACPGEKTQIRLAHERAFGHIADPQAVTMPK